ncbi:S-protein homolog 1-like [Durio zibethinus]|uniref:S-protein homolog n=1 Tax=Durio zibethinus TaxID=66656 RepID=A0A6P5ZHD7_DURZI|nr:S-protein homolog 1-like [Durio zibethinus]
MGISNKFMAILLVVAIALSQISLAHAGKRYYVHIINGLSDNELTIHCQSKDDDLGVHLIQMSKEWYWTFEANFGGTTLFWCNMSWANHHGRFDVYWVNRELLDKCDFKECFWKAEDDGLKIIGNIWEKSFTSGVTIIKVNAPNPTPRYKLNIEAYDNSKKGDIRTVQYKS